MASTNSIIFWLIENFPYLQDYLYEIQGEVNATILISRQYKKNIFNLKNLNAALLIRTKDLMNENKAIAAICQRYRMQSKKLSEDNQKYKQVITQIMKEAYELTPQQRTLLDQLTTE